MAIRPTTERFTSGEVLADQTSDGTSVLTFSFSQSIDLLGIMSSGSDCRIDPFGGTPTGTFGIFGLDCCPSLMSITTSQVKVFSPVSGSVVTVWGFRY